MVYSIAHALFISGDQDYELNVVERGGGKLFFCKVPEILEVPVSIDNFHAGVIRRTGLIQNFRTEKNVIGHLIQLYLNLWSKESK